ncbi:helicase-exonuclease AddAB subunit AddA [Vagococcus fluvialis]|uniref:helicase-exonuclease AddAB subunit AddA n=1 Tax=Vagococcus fluvialis TaxID=2738 RepID=UPI003B5A3C20
MSKHNIPLKPSNSHFTDKQWQSVYDGGDNLLISASAGSGKTTVLVERVIQHIKSGINVDELLIVTYTEAAAREMKQRIQVAIQQGITEEVDSEKRQHLIAQLSLLPTAPISTLHAFCLTVIRKYYYLIHIDPVFRLLTDETEITLLKEDVWEELREKLYGESQEAFYQLTENFSNDRNDNGLTKLIFSLANFAQSNTEPKKWLEGLSEHYAVTDSITESNLYQTLMKPSLIKELSLLVDKSESLIQQTTGEPDFEKTLPIFESDKALILQVLKQIEVDDLEGSYQSLLNNKFATIKGPSKKTSPEEVMEHYESLKKERDIIKKELGTIKKNYFSLSPEKMLSLIKEAKPLVEEIVAVCLAYLDAFKKQKEQKNLVDFNDLEHLTLSILRQENEGEWQASEASTYYRHKFKEVLVDEYQDVNRLQEGILYWLRRPEENQGNLFMVGDVKQSIYAFRLADPTLFIEKYEQYADEKDGRRIILAENFRSRGSVLDFTNLIFTQLMDKELGQIEYDQSAELITGYTGYPESSLHDTEVLIYESETDKEEELDAELTFEIEDKTEGELLLVAQKIKSLIASEFPIYDKKAQVTRPVTYSDIVLLSPTKKNNLVILDVFKEFDIPLLINDTQNYFQATEVRIMVALLQLIDNPYQDIPLAAILRSPIVGAKENDLVKIRQFDTRGYFYEALETYLVNESSVDSLYNKISEFHKQFNHWRELARQEKLVTLIWKIYQDTGLLEYVAGMPSGKQRQANLHALYDRAAAYEEMSFKGLFQFIRFIEKMQAKNKDLAEPNQTGEEEDAVRVMTIHASKGLEFPVVFVLDMNKQFNMTDINNQSFIFDEGLGAGIKFLDSDSRVKYETLPYVLIREQKRKKLLAEEMRKLYVALTRAEEKLFLVGSYKNKEAALKSWQDNVTSDHRVLSTNARLAQRSLLGWVGLSLVRHPQFIKDYPEVQTTPLKGLGEIPVSFKVQFVSKDDLQLVKEESDVVSEELKVTTKADPQLLRKVVDRLSYEYQDQSATTTASYQSVSEIKRLFEDPDMKELKVLDFVKAEETKGNRIVGDELAKPNFLSQRKTVSPAEIGTGTHLVMQMLDLSQTPSEQSIDSLINGLIEDEVLEKEIGEKIDREMIITFFESDFGQYLISNHQSLKREQPFSLLLSADTIFKDFKGKQSDKLLVHGIIDGFIETETELILYDFKTDYMSKKPSSEEIEKIKQKYVGQLNLYKQALEQVKQQKVTSVKLILLKGNHQIEMS